MRRACAVLALAFLGSVAPASAQLAGPAVPSYNPGLPSYNPGVPSYNPGIPRQAPGAAFAPVAPPRVGPGMPPAPTHFVGPHAYPRAVLPYGHRGPTIVVVPQTVIVAPPRRRTTMDNPFFDDLGDPFF